MVWKNSKDRVATYISLLTHAIVDATNQLSQSIILPRHACTLQGDVYKAKWFTYCTSFVQMSGVAYASLLQSEEVVHG